MYSSVILNLMAVVAATTEAPSATPPPYCVVKDVRRPTAKLSSLYLVCPSESLRIGNAESYDSNYNAAARSTVVTRRNGNRVEVTLLSPGGDGRMRIDDLTGDLEKRLIKSGDGTLQPMLVDLKGFASGAAISVSRGSAARGVSTGGTQVSLGSIIRRTLDVADLQEGKSAR